MTTLLGIDVSEGQGTIDFAQVRDAGFCFCICKASEGADFQDPTFLQNLQRIRDLGSGAPFYAGAYHFARPDHRTGLSGGETEGKWFCKVLQDSARSLGISLTRNFIEPVLDMEIYDKSDAGDNVSWIQGFLRVVQSELGRTGMVYSGPNYWKYQVGGTDQFAAAGIPLWQVKYDAQGNNVTQLPPPMLTGTSQTAWTASLWQWSGGGDYAYYQQQRGAIPGIASGIADIDRVMGDMSLLQRLAAASDPIIVVPDSTSDFATLPTVDLNDRRGRQSSTTARVQGLLLSRGYGPSGLVSSKTGQPDGVFGSGTASALAKFKSSVGLPADTVVDARTWQALVQQGLD
jgi:GH25 family lysozyme M1 (1,4-beta-N-acetylmuramidase)